MRPKVRSTLKRCVILFFSDVQLMKVSSRILRAVGKEIGNNWPDILEHLNLEISMEDDTRIGKRNVLASLPIYLLVLHGIQINLEPVLIP